MAKKVNLNIKDLQARVLPIISKIRRYMVVIFIVVLTLIYSFLIFRINSLNRQEPSADAVSEKLATVKRPTVDQNDINKIQQLQDNSVQVQTLFKQARENPFQE